MKQNIYRSRLKWNRKCYLDLDLLKSNLCNEDEAWSLQRSCIPKIFHLMVLTCSWHTTSGEVWDDGHCDSIISWW